MQTPMDDLFGHQLPTTFDHVASSDPNWVERYWYSGHRVPAGDLVLDVGFGAYPNKNVMDAFAGVSDGRTQHNFRASRRLRPDPVDTKVGPLSVEVLEGLRRHRLTLAENESDISFDLVFEATTEPHEESPHFRRREGRVVEDMIRTGQFGRYRGWLEVRGTRHELRPDEWFAQRDHSWGIRTPMRSDPENPPLTTYPPFCYFWAQLQFENFGLHLYAQELRGGRRIYMSGEQVGRIGRADVKRRSVTGFEHDIRWAADPFGQTIDGGHFDLTFEDGTRERVELAACPARYFLKGGLYGGLAGRSQGDDRGRLLVEHDAWDLRSQETRRLARTLSDHVFRANMSGQPGFGIIEYGVAQGYDRYVEAQQFPAV